MASPSTSSKLVLEPNVPQQIALKYPTGKIVESRYGDEKQVYFSLADGRSAYFSLGLAQSITNLQLGTREPFFICKYWNGEKGQAPRYNVWLTPEGEKQRAAQERAESSQMPIPEETPSELEATLAASIAAIQARNRGENLITRRPPAQAAAVPSPQGTGTNGPAPMPQRSQALPVAIQGWGAALLKQTNALIDVYAEACRHAESLNVPAAVVRTVMISAFINISKSGGLDRG